MISKFRSVMEKARARRSVFLSALLLLLLIGALLRRPNSDHPSVSIGNIRYGRAFNSADESPIRATFGLTNTGPVAFSVVPLQEYVIRIEAKDKSVRIDDHRVGKAFIRTSVPPYGDSLLRSGEGITTWVDLPADTKRWQIGYQVTVVSPQSNVRMKLGDKLGKAIVTLFGNWISNEKQAADVWGPVIEMKSGAQARSEESLHPTNAP